tara:strand:+ start:411 stop:545 length:135 start_codon:yes stop_codon:yes gene_type:complete
MDVMIGQQALANFRQKYPPSVYLCTQTAAMRVGWRILPNPAEIA